MYRISDSDSTDSEDGIRFKTDSTRNKTKNKTCNKDLSHRHVLRDRYSPGHRKSYSPSYTKSRHERHRDSRRRNSSLTRSRTPKRRSKSPTRRSKSPKFRSKSPKHRSKSPKHRSKSPKHRSSKYDKYENKSNKGETKESGKNMNENGSINKKSESEESISFGPALPPHLLQTKLCQVAKADDAFGPKVPECIPNRNETNCFDVSTSLILSSDSTSLSPHSKQIKKQCLKEDETVEVKCIGPTIPSYLRERLAGEDVHMTGDDGHVTDDAVHVTGDVVHVTGDDVHVTGDAVHIINDESDKEEEDVYGPVPFDSVHKSEAHIALEERALQMKIDQLNPKIDDEITREEWMLKLPTVHAPNLGFSSRQFRTNPAPDLSDRSSWTDTPEGQARKSKEPPLKVKRDIRKEAELKEVERRDREQEKIIKLHKRKKKDQSLLQMHQDQLKLKKQKEEETGVRRPFNREIDLKVNCFDEAQKKAIFKKSQLLDDRFSQGKSKFL